MEHKRGQVATFVSLGLVLLFLAGIIFYEYQTKAARTSLGDGTAVDVKSVTNFVNLCLQEKSEGALIEVVGKGGYVTLPAYSTERLSDNLPYFLYQGSVFIPTIEKVQENVGLGVEKRLGDCLNFSRFQGVEISVDGSPNVVVLFNPDEAQFTLHQTIKIKSEQSETTLESFTATIPTVFLGMYGHAKKIVETHKNSGEYACLSCLRELNEWNSFKTKTGMTPEGFLYALEEDKKGNDKGIIFRFAVK